MMDTIVSNKRRSTVSFIMILVGLPLLFALLTALLLDMKYCVRSHIFKQSVQPDSARALPPENMLASEAIMDPAAPIPQTTAPVLPTVVWITDTQHYSESNPQAFTDMTEWTVQNRIAHDIRYAIHTGDVVDDWNDPEQWNQAEAALRVLDGKVPLFSVAGNHDIDNESRNFTQYLAILGADRFSALPTFGGAYQNGTARFDLLDIGKTKYILAGISYRPSVNEISWLNQVLSEHMDRTAILCFHSYLDPEGRLTTDGERLLPMLIANNPNIWLVLCGHKHGVYRSAESFDDDGDGLADRTVYQILFNYQNEELGGSGYMRLMRFDDDNRMLRIRTFSPYLDDYDYYADGNGAEEFTIPYPAS